ncbi:MAG: MBOAT family protein [Clostridia bacterium]|nr:MBOAT family protein [Clostridia bacterium]
MGFISLQFFLLAALTLILYYLFPKNAQWLVTMLMSIAFYASYGVERLPFLLASSLIAYLAARKMDRLQRETEDKAEAKKKCRPVLYLALAGLIGLLLYAKIGTWVMQSVGAALKIGGAETAKAIVALGVSYYTFSLISYIADVYWRRDTAETNYLHLLAFTIYFPKILQGPISRHKELAPQMFEKHRFDYRQFCFGVQRMLWGYFKKLVIADRLAIFVNTVFGNVEWETGAHLLVAAVFGAVQSYCDFSGCMDIALGFSECLGLKLAENFDHPFFSRSAAEFWRRWHITLGTWLKDYVYMPLVISPQLIGLSKRMRTRFGVRAGKAVMSVLPLLAVWLLTGFWHGSGLDYITWGLYWGVIIILSNVFAPEIKKLAAALRINTEAGSWTLFQMARTSVLFMVGRLLTAFGDLSKAWLAFRKFFTEFHVDGFFDGSLYTRGLDRPNFLLGIVCVFVLWAVSMLQRNGSVRERLAGSNIVFRWAAYYILFFAIIIFGIYGPGYNAASFIYMQF